MRCVLFENECIGVAVLIAWSDVKFLEEDFGMRWLSSVLSCASMLDGWDD